MNTAIYNLLVYTCLLVKEIQRLDLKQNDNGVTLEIIPDENWLENSY